MPYHWKNLESGGFQIVDDNSGIVALEVSAAGLITKMGNTATTTAVASLTGTVGTANDAMTAIAAPTDTPASADALRDDIATNMIPAINNNFADLQAKVNAILAANRGVIPAT